jgi:anti-sigma28 factor (negative regulator of flagellin synthesis)
MKISDPSGTPVPGLGQAMWPAASGRSGNSAGQSAAGDQIQLSPLLAQLLESGASVHVAKLSKLGAAVAKGQYQADANAVSAAIMQQSLAFGSAW